MLSVHLAHCLVKMASSKMAQKSKFLRQMQSWTAVVEKEAEEENKMKKRPAGATGEDTKVLKRPAGAGEDTIVLKRPGAKVETLELAGRKDRNKDGWYKRNAHLLPPDMHSPLLLFWASRKTKQKRNVHLLQPDMHSPLLFVWASRKTKQNKLFHKHEIALYKKIFHNKKHFMQKQFS